MSLDAVARIAERLAVFVFMTGAALTIGLLLRPIVDRFLEPDQSRRTLIASAIFYGALFLAAAFALLVSRR